MTAKIIRVIQGDITEKPIPDFEPGYVNTDDLSLDHLNYPQWHNVWPLPSPMHGVHPIEAEASNTVDNAMFNDLCMGSDWGDPGKQHSTNNVYTD